MPSRTGGKTTCYQIDRRFRGVGRVKLTSGTTSLREFYRRNDVLTTLYEDRRLDVLCALRDGVVSVVEVCAAHRKGAGHSLAAIALVSPLWASMRQTLPTMGKSRETRDRYALTFASLEACGVIPPTALVRDLESVEWVRVRPHFKSAADWNHVCSGVSSFLTRYLGDVQHPFRRAVMKRLKKEAATERVPDVTVTAFLSAVARAPEWAHAPLMALALSGVRMGEYIHATDTDLRPLTKEWVVSGKTGPRVVTFADDAWPIITAAVPARYARAPLPGQKNGETQRYQRLAGAWKRATKKEGITCNLHDLRHLAGQLASDAGLSDQMIRHFLGHRNTSTTGRYTRRTQRREASDAVATALLKRRA